MKKKVLFVDRDGTIIAEPADEQIDSLEKLQILPFAISCLKKAMDLGYELIMVSNQDGLGTAAFPEADFLAPHHKLLQLLEGEGVLFSHIFIDRSFEHENKPTRKPETGMLDALLAEDTIDLTSSFTVGDRLNDIRLARNLGCRSICLQGGGLAEPVYEQESDIPDFKATGWLEVLAFLRQASARKVNIERNTAETRIKLSLNLDGTGEHRIHTGLHFYDHMLDQLSRHSGMDIHLEVDGDLQVDEHHTIEDSAIALGTALKMAMGDKRGMERYAFVLPMDEALVSCALDFSGRAWCIFEGSFDREYVGDFPTEMFGHWLHSFSEHAGLNLNLQILQGSNTHHKIEASFKALARCLKQALRVSGDQLPSTKGIL